MIFQLTWLAEVLESAGLKVAEVPGWRSRGRADMGRVLGVMCHHTANRQSGNMPTLGQLIHGRAGSKDAQALAGPLAQLGLGRDGTFYVVAAGRANHAGQGLWEGLVSGNSNFIGIEAENDGRGEEWPAVQMEAYQRGVAAILRKIDAPASMCCGHKEYATPPGRKPDPDFDMPSFRKAVASYLNGKSPPALIAGRDDKHRPTLRRGQVGDAVMALQAHLQVEVNGVFDGITEAELRKKQIEAKLVPDGILGPKSWAALIDETPATADANASDAASPPARPPTKPGSTPDPAPPQAG